MLSNLQEVQRVQKHTQLLVAKLHLVDASASEERTDVNDVCLTHPPVP